MLIINLMGMRDEISSDRSLLADLNRRFRAPLMAYFLRRTRDTNDAEDLTQDTFVRLMRSSRTFETNTHVQAYIFQVAANLLKDRSRRQSVRKQAPLSSFREDLIDVILNRIVEARHPERVLIGRQSLAEVYKVLEHLDPRTRNIFILYRLEGMKHREIAALFGIGLSTVEKHCTLAMAELVAQFPDKVL